MENITSTTDILNKEDYDFKFELGVNDSGDKIVRVLKSPVGKNDYTLVMEILLDEQIKEEMLKRTEPEILLGAMEKTTIPFTEKERETIISIIKKYG